MQRCFIAHSIPLAGSKQIRKREENIMFKNFGAPRLWLFTVSPQKPQHLPCWLGSGSICEWLGGGALRVQQIETREHGSTLSWWHSTLFPEAQTSAHCGTQLATFHWGGQFGSTLDAQLLDLDSKERTSIGLWSREADTEAEDVVEPEGITKASRPIKQLLAAPSVTTSKLFVEANANWGSRCWRQGALISEA